MDGMQEGMESLHAQHTAREWALSALEHEGLNAGVYGPQTLDGAGVAI
jgi:hypothetical protein